MRRTTAIAALLSAAAALAQDPSESTGEAPGRPYTAAQCDSWLAGILASDADGSGGLGEVEFASFLGGIDDPPHVKEYFADLLADGTGYADLPWLLKVVHKSLACRCQDLGMGENCCELDGAEVPLPAVPPPDGADGGEDGDDVAAMYRVDICNQIAFAFDSVVGRPAGAVPDAGSAGDGTGEAGDEETEAGEAEAEEDKTGETETGETEPGSDSSSGSDSSLGSDSSSGSDPSSGSETSSGSDPSSGSETSSGSDSSSGSETSPGSDPAGYMTFDVVGSTVDYSAFDYESAIFGAAQDLMPDFLNAREITDGDGNNGVLEQFVDGFGSLAVEVAGGMMASPAKRSAFGGRRVQDQGDGGVVVKDTACPRGLLYAPADAFCVEFSVQIKQDGPSPLDPEDAVKLWLGISEELRTRIASGELYRRIKAAHPDTAIAGLGNPGDGIPYAPAPRDVGSLADEPDGGDDSGGGGVGTGGIVGIIIALVAVPVLVLWASKRYDQQRRQERDFHGGKAAPRSVLAAAPPPVEDVEAPRPAAPAPDGGGGDDESEAPSVWSGDGDSVEDIMETGDAPSPTAGSALAAMGAASAVAAGMATPKKKSDSERKVRSLVDEVQPGKTADELLAAYSGREDELIGHLSRMKSESAVDSLVKELNPGKSTKELMAAYEGREDELIGHLETMREMRASESGDAGDAPSSPPAVVGGTQGEWIEMTGGAPADAESGAAGDAPPGPPAVVGGTRGEWIEIAEGAPAVPPSASAVADEVDALVSELNPGKTAEELMAAYSGREDELVSHLRKLKSSKSGEMSGEIV